MPGTSGEGDLDTEALRALRAELQVQYNKWVAEATRGANLIIDRQLRVASEQLGGGHVGNMSLVQHEAG